MRVYFSGNLGDLEILKTGGTKLPGRVGFANLAQWANDQPDQDPEVLENELLLLAGDQSNCDGRRLVLVVECSAAEKAPKLGHVLVDDFKVDQVVAFFTDDQVNKKAILTGSEPRELPLTWFGPTEILELLDFIEQ